MLAIASIASTGGLGWSRRIPVHMELLQTQGFDAALAGLVPEPKAEGEGRVRGRGATVPQ